MHTSLGIVQPPLASIGFSPPLTAFSRAIVVNTMGGILDFFTYCSLSASQKFSLLPGCRRADHLLAERLRVPVGRYAGAN